MTLHDDVRVVRLAEGDTLTHTTPLDPLVAPVLEDLEHEYDARYGGRFGEPASTEIQRYPAPRFSAPDGTFLLLLREGRAISAGAFMTVDDVDPGVRTAEIKRVWTSADHRGQGLARIVLAELEAEATRRGFDAIVLSTGPRQPEAVRLYLATGYTPLFDTSLDPDVVIFHHFRKDLSS